MGRDKFAAFIKSLKFNNKGLIPAIIQDERSKRVLTLCYMNRRALKKTLEEGLIYVYRRSQKLLMLKGVTSGHIQKVKSIYVDCENNSLLFMVKQNVAACHKGYFSCYFRKLTKDGKSKISQKRIFKPAKVYK